ncbi:hypothetical protein B0I37DRAFT_436151 [Chaetomium sp. MPI-CAGE-AT-0009]|nr:hypothetical protein B0I37DRAFT_436151 [Chaetomium sp. MPI-CAGE-AT-0009]
MAAPKRIPTTTMLNTFSAIATRASQRILGNQPSDAPDDQQLSPVSPSGSPVDHSEDIEGTLESQPHAEGPTSSEEGPSLEEYQQPDEIYQHPEEDLHLDVHQPHGETQGLEEDEDISSESQAQSSAFNHIFNRIQASEQLVRETPPSIEGYTYNDADQLPAYSSQPPSGVIVIPNIQEDARSSVSGSGMGDVGSEAESQHQQAYESQDEQTPPPSYVPSTLQQELLRAGLWDLSDSSSGTASDIGTDGGDGISGDEQVLDEGGANETQVAPQKTPDELAEETEGLEQPEAYSQTHHHASSLNAPVNSPLRDQDVGEDKDETDRMVTPSPPLSNTDLNLVQRSIRDISGEDVPATDEKGPTPPSSPNPSFQDPQSRRPPIFIPTSDVSEDSFAPFYKGSLRKQGESTADVIVRDQIRRCEAICGRPLTGAEKEVIRSYYRDMDRPRGPDEVSEPTFIHSPGALAEIEKSMGPDSVWGARDDGHDLDGGTSPSITKTIYKAKIEELREDTRSIFDILEVLVTRLEKAEAQAASDKKQLLNTIDKRTGDLSRKIGEIESRQDGAEQQLTSNQWQLNAACADIARFQVEKQDIDEGVARLEKEMETVMNELHNKSRDDVDNKSDNAPDNTSENELDNRSKSRTTLGGSGDPQVTESTQSPARRFQQAVGFNLSLVVLAMMALVWFVTEAMLHSKRLSDGYGPFINGGYNGLGSVVIFGTWTKFFLFYAVALYLGVFSVTAALRQ